MSLREFIKSILPRPLRAVLRGLLHFVQRIGRWPIILWQVRGATTKDEWILLQSALAAPILSMKSLLKWQDPILLGDATVVVSGIGRFSLRARTDDLWHVVPWREHAIFNVLREKLKAGDVFVDAGANIGVYTVLASRLVGPTGRVIAVEMMPDTAGRLELHIAMNELKNVTVVRRALSDEFDKIVVATVQAGKFGQATIVTDSKGDGHWHSVEVRTTTLDEVCNHCEKVHLVKMDLEGAELQALRGATQLLKKVGALVYENWARHEREPDPVGQLLKRSGFKLRQLDGNNWLAEKVHS